MQSVPPPTQPLTIHTTLFRKVSTVPKINCTSVAILVSYRTLIYPLYRAEKAKPERTCPDMTPCKLWPFMVSIIPVEMTSDTNRYVFGFLLAVGLIIVVII